MRCILMICVFLAVGCGNNHQKEEKEKRTKVGVELVVLGTVQDAGAPHIGCKKSCCMPLWSKPDETLKVVSLGVIDHDNNKVYILEATPDFTDQLAAVNKLAGRGTDQMPDGVFITHAHIGHYTGLMYLGREAKGAKNVPVYVMPKMEKFLSSNGPWDQLVNINNIALNTLDSTGIQLTEGLHISPFLVPHRDEYSETVGFIIAGKQKDAVFIPDIDKWSKWEQDIVTEIEAVDYAFLDATFYDEREIAFRSIGEIPHPFVIESMKLFKDLTLTEKRKVHFIHLNHTNPLLQEDSEAYQEVLDNGFFISKYLQKFAL